MRLQTARTLDVSVKRMTKLCKKEKDEVKILEGVRGLILFIIYKNSLTCENLS